MKKPYGRKTKKKVSQLLAGPSQEEALSRLALIPDEQLVGHLFAHLYHCSEVIKFRAALAMGDMTERMARHAFEKARIVLRRIMWNLNDESGGIGWGSPEAMGEVLARSPELAEEFKSILFSYLDPGGNFIEHEILQRGVIWGIGTFLQAAPQDLESQTKNRLFGHLHSLDPVVRGYALRALINARAFDCRIAPEAILSDEQELAFFDGWDLVPVQVKELAAGCRHHGIYS